MDGYFILIHSRNKWEAVYKDNYKELFSGGTNVIRNSSLEVLKDIIVNK